MVVTGESGEANEMQIQVQQSPLASQRAKQEGNTARNGQAARAGGFFTLGYKEGFSQWVGHRNGNGNHFLSTCSHLLVDEYTPCCRRA